MSESRASRPDHRRILTAVITVLRARIDVVLASAEIDASYVVRNIGLESFLAHSVTVDDERTEGKVRVVMIAVTAG
jgi:hypothetical protein